MLHGGEPIQIAPNGQELAFSAFDFGGPNVHISVAGLAEARSGRSTTWPVVDSGGIAYLAPDGRELVYLARSSNLHTHDIRALDVTSGQTRAILETPTGNDIFGNVSAAPDGKHIAYALKRCDGHDRIHVVGANGRDDRVVGHAPGATSRLAAMGPAGRRLLIERALPTAVVHPVIVDLGGGPDVVVDTEISRERCRELWSPDGASILAQRTAADGQQLQQELWDARTGAVTPVSWPS